MGRPIQPWPKYALEDLELLQDRLLHMERLGRDVQSAIGANDTTQALILLSDLRVQARQAFEQTIRARTGNYEQLEQRPPWTSQDKTTQPTAVLRPGTRAR